MALHGIVEQLLYEGKYNPQHKQRSVQPFSTQK